MEESLTINKSDTTEIQKYLRDYIPQPLLPLMHISTAKNFVSIMSTFKLTTRHCDFFDEPLLYFFYGRPAYKPLGNNPTVTNQYLFPVCFIIDPKKISGIKRIFPFDTGALFKGHYDEHFNPEGWLITKGKRKEFCEIFNMGIEIENCAKLVTAFYDTNIRYLTGDVKKVEIDYFFANLNTYYDLISESGLPNADDRKYSIEVQVNENIDLSECISAIVLPSQACDRAEVISLLKRLNLTYLPYYSIGSAQSRFSDGALFSKVVEYLNAVSY